MKLNELKVRKSVSVSLKIVILYKKRSHKIIEFNTIHIWLKLQYYIFLKETQICSDILKACIKMIDSAHLLGGRNIKDEHEEGVRKCLVYVLLQLADHPKPQWL